MSTEPVDRDPIALKASPSPFPVAITAEDLVPPPYVANAVPNPVPGADFGLGIRHLENQLFITFDPWASIGVGDAFEYFMGDTRFAKAEDEIRTGQDTQRLYQLSIPRERVPTGAVYPCYGRVVRGGTGRESTSVPIEFFIKDTRPGGTDQDPELPYHSALKLHLPADLQAPSAVLDPDRASSGVVCTLERYPEIHLGDTIELYWNGRLVTLQLDSGHVAGSKPIEVLVPWATIALAGSGLLTLRFRVRDVVFNYSSDQPVYQWSQAVHLKADLDPNLLERPYFQVDFADTTDVNFDTQGSGKFQVEVVVPTVLPNGNRTPVGAQIVVILTGTLVDGTSLVERLPAVEARINRSTYIDVENYRIEQLINGSVQISYELHFSLGTIIGNSRRLMVTVFGTVVTMPPLRVVEAESGLIDPTVPYITVEFPEYTPYDRNYPVTLRMEATRPGGGVEFYEQTLLAGDPPPPTRFRIVPNSEFQRFVGLGDVRMLYRVDDGLVSPLNPGPLTIRDSEDLIVQFGPRVATLPNPEIEGLDLLDNLDPNDVIGQALVTLPYATTLPGDTFVWRWVGSGVGGSTGGSITLNNATAGAPVSFNVDKAFVDANRNGEFRLSYSLERAGATTLRSDVRTVTVGPSLGDLLRPEVREASRAPDELRPEAVTGGATVVVEFSQMRPTDRIRATWSGISGIGTHSETKDGNDRKLVTFSVPAEVVGVNIGPAGREINVQYFLIRGGARELPSRILTVLLLPLTTLPIPTLEGIGDSAILDISRLNGSERTVINIWQFIHAAQRMWLVLSGIYSDGRTFSHSTYTADLVNNPNVTQGVLAPTPVAELRQLRDGSQLTIQFWVSFDRSASKVNALLFRERHYVIQALPSVLPHPVIGGASGTGTSVTLEPLASENNTQVSVKYDGMSGNDRTTLNWIYQDGTVHSNTLDGLAGGTRVFNISNNVLARSVNSTIELNYSVVRAGIPDPVPSHVQTVRVNTIPLASLHAPLINNLPPGGVLDITSLTTTSRLTIAPWRMQYSGMKVWMTFRCAGASPNPFVTWTGQAHHSTAGLDTPLHSTWLTWLNTCPDGAQLSIEFKVGYANDSTEALAVSFPVTNYTVQSEQVIPRIIKEIPVNYFNDILASPDGRHLYVALYSTGATSIVVIETTNYSIAYTIDVPEVHNVATLGIKPDSSQLYVAGGSSSARGVVAVVDTQTRRTIKTIVMSEATHCRGVAFNPKNSNLYVSSGGSTASGNSFVDAYETANFTRVKRIADNIDAYRNMEVNQDGTRLYVMSPRGGYLVIDAETNTLIRSVFGIYPPDHLALSRVGVNPPKLYLSAEERFLYSVDLTTESTYTFPHYNGFGIATNPRLDLLYTAARSGLIVIDTKNDIVLETVGGISGVRNIICTSPDGRFIYFGARVFGTDNNKIVILRH